jgi:predicted RNA binding protein YcfA (HicA-like mRNA interferase family)
MHGRRPSTSPQGPPGGEANTESSRLSKRSGTTGSRDLVPRPRRPPCSHAARGVLAPAADVGHAPARLRGRYCAPPARSNGTIEANIRVARSTFASGAVPWRPLASLALMAKRYRDVRKALTDAGWRVVRQAGSHEIWAHADREARIVVAGKDSDTVPVGTLGSIRRASGLEHLR